MSEEILKLVDESENVEKNAIDIPEDPAEDLAILCPIQNRYTFWYKSDTDKASRTNYKDCIKKIASFQSVERYWQIYDHLKRPFDFKSAEFHLFKDGIFPIWEDPQNKAGGKWTIRLKKGIASRYWEDILLAMIGEQFDVGSEICGAVLSVRMNEDLISVWNKTADNQEAVNKIREQIRRIVRLPNMITIEYKRHQESLVDRSSYRNPTMVWRAPTKTSAENTSNTRFNNFNKQQNEGANKQNNQPDGSQPTKPAWKNARWSNTEGEKGERKSGENSNEWRRNPPGKDSEGGGSFASKLNRPPLSTNNSDHQDGPTNTDNNDHSSRAVKQSGDVWTKVKNPFVKDK